MSGVILFHKMNSQVLCGGRVFDPLISSKQSRVPPLLCPRGKAFLLLHSLIHTHIYTYIETLYTLSQSHLPLLYSLHLHTCHAVSHRRVGIIIIIHRLTSNFDIYLLGLYIYIYIHKDRRLPPLGFIYPYTLRLSSINSTNKYKASLNQHPSKNIFLKIKNEKFPFFILIEDKIFLYKI